jgi:DNA topoisomerase-1
VTITGNQNEKKLYELIWKRTIASQMADAEVERTTLSIAMNTSPVIFSSTGEVIKFDGFLKVYAESTDLENSDDEKYIIPPVKKGMLLHYDTISATQKYTSPLPRYTEASLVKKLEELGIGRPSTYAPTISTIQNRGYVLREDRPGEKRQIKIIALSKGTIISSSKTEAAGKEKSKLFPQDIGMIAEGKLKWTGMLGKFYSPFHKTVEKTLEKKNRKTGVRILGTHPETGEQVSVKMGRFGPVAQIGDSDNGGKPRFASLAKSQLLETITLPEALNLFRLPRSLGMYEGDEMVVGIGKFGPYVRYRSKFYSLKKGVDDPYSVTIERATEIIREKGESDKKKVVKDFGEIRLLNGRYGPYLTQDKKNYRLPKGTQAEKLTKEDCIRIIEKSEKTKKSTD